MAEAGFDGQRLRRRRAPRPAPPSSSWRARPSSTPPASRPDRSPTRSAASCPAKRPRRRAGRRRAAPRAGRGRARRRPALAPDPRPDARGHERRRGQRRRGAARARRGPRRGGGHARAVGRPRHRRRAKLLLARRRCRARGRWPTAWASRTSRSTCASASAAEVVDDFVDEHAAGRTPNPCVRCNGQVRFDAMLDAGRPARRGPAGHRPLRAHRPRRRRPAAARGGRPAQGPDLHARPPEPGELDRLWFPLGELDEARGARAGPRRRPAGGREAREPGPLLPRGHSAADDFLRRHAPVACRRAGRDRGPATAACSGSHDGQHRFTVGQRRGIGVAAREPLYVLDKDAAQRPRDGGPARGAGRPARACSTGAMLHRDAGRGRDA